MSGVTVATISRSISAARTPACSSAARAAGSAMSESASSSAAKRRSLMPVRVDDPLVRRVDEPREVVVRDHPLGHVRHPSPVIETGVPFAAPIMAVSVSLGRRREGERAANGQLVADPTPWPSRGRPARARPRARR